MFEQIQAAPADAILGLADLFRQEQRPNKINLGIGVYKNGVGQTPILTSVKKAELQLLETEKSKNYLNIEGLASYAQLTQQLLLGENSHIIHQQRACTAQAPGGTGALRIAAEFIKRNTASKRVWLSQPSWPNHRQIFSALGFEICEYRYYDAQNHALDFSQLLQDLQQAKAGDVVLFHGCCHNPTGIDPSATQWTELAEISASRGWLPLFDVAYQGFGQGLEQDAQGIRLFAAKHSEMLIANSYSKNFGLYNERVGACTLIAADSEIAVRAFSQIKSIIRTLYSNPPAHGANVVAQVLADADLTALWQQEVTDMRQRIQRMRQLFVSTLQEKGAKQDFNFINQQNGMFSFSGLNRAQVQRLRDEFAIYIVDSGRINIAGMTTENMAPLCEAIVAVL